MRRSNSVRKAMSTYTVLLLMRYKRTTTSSSRVISNRRFRLRFIAFCVVGNITAGPERVNLLQIISQQSGQISGLSNQITTLNGQLATANAKIASQSSVIAAQGAVISALQSRVKGQHISLPHVRALIVVTLWSL